MPHVEIDTEPALVPSPFRPEVTVWQPPDWLVAVNAEVARLSQLSEEERQREWDELPEAKKAAYDEAFDQVMQNLAEGRSRLTIFNPPGT